MPFSPKRSDETKFAGISRWLCGALTAAGFLAGMTPAGAPAHGGFGEPVRIVVKLKSGAPDAEAATRLAAIARQAGASVARVSPVTPAEWQVWTVDPGARESLAAALRACPDVALLEPAQRRSTSIVPNDPDYGQQWSLKNSGQLVYGTAGTPGADIGAETFWNSVTGSSSVVVAVIDTGVHLANTDLAGRFWVNTVEQGGIAGVDDDSNGFVDDVNGWNFNSNNNNVNDAGIHGTACASIIGAATNNGTAMAGLNWNVKIMALRGFDGNGSGDDPDLAAAIDYARVMGAQVINASWGGEGYAQVLTDAVDRARQAGVIFVAAADNKHHRMDLHPSYPAALRLPNVLSVGASDHNDALPYFTNRGGTGVDVFAPGYGIWTTVASNTYNRLDGTSFAAPHVAGAAALLLSQPSPPSWDTVVRRLRAAGTLGNSFSGQAWGGRRLYLPDLLPSDTTPPADIADLASAAVTVNGAVLTWTAPGDDGAAGTARTYELRTFTTPPTLGNFHTGTLPEWLPSPIAGGTAQTWTLAGLEAGTTCYVAIRTSDEAGNSSGLSNVLSVTTTNGATYLSEGAESGAGGWTAQSPWAISSVFSRTGTKSWSTVSGSPSAAGSYTLVSPSFSLSGAQRPVLVFHQARTFDVDFVGSIPATPPVHGRVEISIDGGSTWRSLRTYHSGDDPFSREFLPLLDYAGAAAAKLRWVLQVTSGGRFSTTWSLDDIRVFEATTILPEPTTILVEPVTEQAVYPNDSDSYAETGSIGAWTTSINYRERIAYVNAWTARQCLLANAASATATWTPLFGGDGLYHVYVSWPATANAANVRYKVNHAGGTSTVFLDQNGPSNGRTWVSLGTYVFPLGRSATMGSVVLEGASVTGTATNAISGLLTADSLRFDFIGPAATASSGAWMHAH